jgi:hypothetical protein
MNDELNPRSRRLLEFERARGAPGAEVEQRVMGRLATSIMAAPLALEVPPSPASTPISNGLHLSGTKLLLFAGVWVGVGAALNSWLREPAVRVVEVVRSVPTPEPVTSPPETPAKVVEQDVAPEPTLAAPEPRKGSGSAPEEAPALRERDRELAAERALLEKARTALARQVPAAALEALSEHERRFADGQLREEREGLEVLALFAAGNVERARTRVIEFRARYPQSVLLRAIRSAEESSLTSGP